ncbi:MAG: glycosyltransferase family 2 protein, partial [Alphaproteobacteria bacterium]
WLCPVRPGDRLAPHALAVIAAALDRADDACMAYTDTVRCDGAGMPREVELKPGFDPVLDAARPYARELALVRRDAPAGPHAPLHIPYPALLTDAPAETRPFAPPAPDPLPAISIVIPSRDRGDLIGPLLQGLFEETDYPGLEVIVVDNGSSDPEVLAEYDRRAAQGLRVLRHDAPFNFSAMINRGVDAARGAAFLLLNNDIEVTEPGWLREMAACLNLPGTGIVGARLDFPDGRLQHAGVITGMDRGHAGHWYSGRPADTEGIMQRLRHRGSFSAVTAACMLISRDCWQRTGPFDEEVFAVAYNDVDFCLRAGQAGFGVVWTPHASLIHHERASRRRASPGKLAQFWAERRALRARHQTHRRTDPAISPWLRFSGTVPVPRLLPAIPPPRRFRTAFATQSPECRA